MCSIRSRWRRLPFTWSSSQAASTPTQTWMIPNATPRRQRSSAWASMSRSVEKCAPADSWTTSRFGDQRQIPRRKTSFVAIHRSCGSRRCGKICSEGAPQLTAPAPPPPRVHRAAPPAPAPPPAHNTCTPAPPPPSAPTRRDAPPQLLGDRGRCQRRRCVRPVARVGHVPAGHVRRSRAVRLPVTPRK